MIDVLQNNIEKLISAYETQKARAIRVEAELDACRKALEDARGKNNKLEEKIDSLSLRDVFTSSTADSGMAKARIDRLIKEIDKALALLQ